MRETRQVKKLLEAQQDPSLLNRITEADERREAAKVEQCHQLAARKNRLELLRRHIKKRSGLRPGLQALKPLSDFGDE